MCFKKKIVFCCKTASG